MSWKHLIWRRGLIKALCPSEKRARFEPACKTASIKKSKRRSQRRNANFSCASSSKRLRKSWGLKKKIRSIDTEKFEARLKKTESARRCHEGDQRRDGKASASWKSSLPNMPSAATISIGSRSFLGVFISEETHDLKKAEKNS